MLRVAGPELFASIARTLAPAEGGEAADLHIDLWDAAATGVAVPNGHAHHGTRQGVAGGWLLRSTDGRWVTQLHRDSELCLDHGTGRMIGGVRVMRPSPGWHPARPLQDMLIHWLAAQGQAVVHAAMVVHQGVGALVAGPTGHGKSTTAAAGLAAGMGVLGDDTVAVEAVGDRWTGHCLHATVKVRTALPARLDAHTVPLTGPWEGESALFLPESFPQSVVRGAPIVAILLPRLSDAPTSTIAPVTAGRALATLTPEALSLEPGDVRTGFERVSRLASGVPAFRLEVGRDPASIPAAVAPLLERLSGS
jgi:hypothetical protein